MPTQPAASGTWITGLEWRAGLPSFPVMCLTLAAPRPSMMPWNSAERDTDDPGIGNGVAHGPCGGSKRSYNSVDERVKCSDRFMIAGGAGWRAPDPDSREL